MTITALPVLNRTDATFRTDVDTFFGTELPQFSIEAEGARVEINANLVLSNTAVSNAALQVTLAQDQALLSATSAGASQSYSEVAETQASIAISAANNKGSWLALMGTLNIPASVVHNNRIWILKVNLIDVTMSEPGVSVDWQEIQVPTESPYVCAIAQVNVPLTTTSKHSLNAVVVVDANRTLLLTRSTDGTHAVVYDKATGTCGAAVLVRSGAASFPKGILCATDRVLVCTCPNTTALQAVVLSLSGTAITVGTPVSTTLSETGYIFDEPITVGSSYVFGLASATNARAFAVTVSGTIPTVGVAVNSHAGTDTPLIRSIDSTRFLLVARDGTTLVYATPYTVSGSTLTKGTSATFTGSFVQTVAALSSGRFAVVYTNTATWGAIVTVASTTASATTVQLGTGAAVYGGGTKVGGNQLIVPASTTEVNVLTDVSGTATAGTALNSYPGSSASPIGYGVDYVTYHSGLSADNVITTIKISGNNAVISSLTPAYLPTLTGGGVSMSTGIPSNVLSVSGKSVKVLQSNTSPVPYAVQCGTEFKTKILHPVPSVHIKESDAVLWTASTGAVAANSVNVNRLELI